jgi:hypothetical protein
MLIEKVRQRNFLYDSMSPDYGDRHMRANAWEGIGKELKMKRKFCVSSRDVRIVCPQLNLHMPCRFPAICSDSAVSFVKVRVVAGNIRTASPTV